MSKRPFTLNIILQLFDKLKSKSENDMTLYMIYEEYAYFIIKKELCR